MDRHSATTPKIEEQASSLGIKDQPGAEFDKVYEAWKQLYPQHSAQEISEIIGVNRGTTQTYISHINATQGNVPATKRLIELYVERSKLRNAISRVHDIETLKEMWELDREVTREMDSLYVKKKKAITHAHRNIYERLAMLDKQEPGLTAAEAAKRLGCSPSTIASYRSRRGKANDDPFFAEKIRTDDARERRRIARAKLETEAEWKASGIDG